MKLFQKRLKQIEIIEQKTPEEIAEIIGVSRATYFNYKAGLSVPDYDALKRLVDRFKIDAGWLFSEKII
jgi:transcriptional regulator with XRE-family HTH domain